MEFVNTTRMAAGYNLGLEPSGRELLVVVVKGSFAMPRPGEPVRLLAQQLPLCLADTFEGVPGLSAPLQEVDYAPRKPRCEVLLTGHAHAPAGTQVTRQRVGLRVGPLYKAFDVVGDRVWQAGLGGFSASSPAHFSTMPVGYGRAFGGTDCQGQNPSEHDAYPPNPVGRGWHRHLKAAWVDDTPLPNTEAIDQPVTAPDGRYTPMAFGPLGRGWPQRARHAGTYDGAWLAHAFPFLPSDFDERYHQAAPDDQQLVLPDAPMQVLLGGFHADGPRRFALPRLELPVQVYPRRGSRQDHVASLDTIAFEPDLERFSLSWRVAVPLRDGLLALAQVVVGCRGRDWWQQREQLAVNAPPLVHAALKTV